MATDRLAVSEGATSNHLVSFVSRCFSDLLPCITKNPTLSGWKQHQFLTSHNSMGGWGSSALCAWAQGSCIRLGVQWGSAGLN